MCLLCLLKGALAGDAQAVVQVPMGEKGRGGRTGACGGEGERAVVQML